MGENARPMGLWSEPPNASIVALGPVRWSWHYDAGSAEYTLQEGAPNDRAAFVWDDVTESYILQPSTDGDTPEVLVVKVGDTIFHVVPPT
jgi:hypothetical protein